MTFTNLTPPEPTMWLLSGVVEHRGDQYQFWYEFDGRDGDAQWEFVDKEPSDDFDWHEFQRRCQAEVDKAVAPREAA